MLLGVLDVFALGRRSRAVAVVLLIDGCRDGIRLQVIADPVVPKGLPEAADANAEVPTIAMVYSCGAGESSYAALGEDGTSYFTEALCQVLMAEDDCSRLGDVLDGTQARLAQLLPAGKT